MTLESERWTGYALWRDNPCVRLNFRSDQTAGERGSA